MQVAVYDLSGLNASHYIDNSAEGSSQNNINFFLPWVLTDYQTH